MLKKMLLIGAAAVSFPAMAQNQPAEQPAPPPAESQPAPTPADPAPTDPTPAPDASSTPPAADTTAQPAPAGNPAATTQPAPSSAPATATQIAQIVEKEFPTYDGDKNGELNESEFAAWMKKLRSATEPGIDTESEAVKTWVGQAFAAADADKSTGVNKTELTGFLSRGA